MRSSIGFVLIAAFLATPAEAVPTAAPGFLQLAPLATPEAAFGGVAVVADAVFVGQDALGVQSIVRIDAGGATTLATGFSGLSGMVYDPLNDRLVVGANEIGPGGAGDTLFGVPDPFGSPPLAPDASTLALAPSGSVPFVADVVLDPLDPMGQTLLVSDASGPPGALLRIDVSNPLLPVSMLLQAPQGFAGGVVADPAADALYFGDAFTGNGSLVLGVPLSDPTATALQVGSVLGGQFDLALDAEGLLYSTSFGDVVRIDPTTDETLTVATGFGFATAIDESQGVIYALDFGVNEIYRFAVPEPGTLPGVLLGLAWLARRRARRS